MKLLLLALALLAPLTAAVDEDSKRAPEEPDPFGQACAAAAFTIVLSLPAGRALLAHADAPEQLRPAIRQTVLAAHVHGLVLAATIAFGRGGEWFPR